MISPTSVKDIFNDALLLTPGEQREFLERACGSDTALRDDVERLLAAYQTASDFLCAATDGGLSSFGQGPTCDDTHSAGGPEPGCDRSFDDDLVSPVIDRYRLLRRIGEGGFGTVYLARQEQPVVRDVAVKIIKAGMDTRHVIRRFEAERQTLAVMDHPGIARILDAGATPEGRPYFAMEYVAGRAITSYCRDAHLDLRARLALFVEVCNAVQHAHQKGVIHRDIKPSNILVAALQVDGVTAPARRESGSRTAARQRGDGSPTHASVSTTPQAKIIDFGIAKAIARSSSDAMQLTDQQHPLGTPTYMSPEQAGLSADIDTRSDVYSLGVVLYELLTGVAPFDTETLRRGGPAELQRIIREVDPPRPSARLSGAEARALRGDLDWIVMKCLEKDRTRRYETVNGLAMDVQRHLRGDAVVAAPPGAAYRLRKFLRRNRGAVLAAALVAAALVMGMVGTAWQAARATDERDRALAAQARANAETGKARSVQAMLERILTFPQPMLSMSRSGPPDRWFSPDVRLIEVVDDAVAKLDGAFPDQPEIEADVRLAIGKSYFGMSRMADSTRELTQALALYQAQFGDEDLRTLDCLHMLGWACSWIGDYERAAGALRAAAVGFARKLGPRDDRTLSAKISLVMFLAGMEPSADAEEPEQLAREVLALRSAALPESSREVNMARAVLAFALGVADKREEALQLARSAMAQLEQSPERNEGDEFFCRLALGNSELFSGHLVLAEEQFRAIVDSSKRVPGAMSIMGAAARGRLGVCLLQQRRWADAEVTLRESVTAFRECAGPAHPYTAFFTRALARARYEQGEVADAQAILQALLDAGVEALGPDHPNTRYIRQAVVEALLEQDQCELAEPLARDLAESCQRGQTAPPGELLEALLLWAQALNELERQSEAEPVILDAVAVLEMRLAGRHPRASDVLNTAGNVLWDRGDFARAEPYYGRSLEIRTRTLGPTHWVTLWSQYRQAWCRWQIGRKAEGEAQLRDAVAHLRRSDNYALIQALFKLALIARSNGDTAERARLLDEMVAVCERVYPGKSAGDAECLALYGGWLLDEEQFEPAEKLLRTAVNCTEATTNPALIRYRAEALRKLIRLCELREGVEPQAGYRDQEVQWRAQLSAVESSASDRNATPVAPD